MIMQTYHITLMIGLDLLKFCILLLHQTCIHMIMNVIKKYSNDVTFFKNLQTFSQQLQQQSQSKGSKEIQRVKSRFDGLPDGLLCQIASYLPAKNIFSKWNRVNRKFIQIGLKPIPDVNDRIIYYAFKSKRIQSH